MNIYQKLLSAFRRKVAGTNVRMTYSADGFGVRKKYIPFQNDKQLSQVWQQVCSDNDPHWFGETPDIRWRVHVCVWAASNCLRLEGDFAEFGVNTGILSSAVMKLVDVDSSGKKFFLFDTYEGIPEDMATQSELKRTQSMNKDLYSGDILGTAQRVFSAHKSAEIVQGLLPGSICEADFKSLAYVSIDLNSVNAEMSGKNIDSKGSRI